MKIEIWNNVILDEEETKDRIMARLNQSYALEDLGDALFVRKKLHTRTLCIEFLSQKPNARMESIREIADKNGENSGAWLYQRYAAEPEHEADKINAKKHNDDPVGGVI